MKDDAKQAIVKTYISLMKKDDITLDDKLQLLFELDPRSEIYNYLLYNIFTNIEEDNIRRHCVIFMDDTHLRAAMTVVPKWFEDE
ncbi:hypothetical protein LCGC14_0728970 [marine sediment metagenome]|uniref:Uncharacterized protein n=1 Tax=marine sediment metagenome TaxID=412755 RepID=A0A0F9QA94_9ZZZZ